MQLIKGVELSCSLQRERDRLQVDYAIVNRGDVDVAVMDQIKCVGIDGANEWLTNSVYVHLEGETLHLTKASLPIPDGLYPALYEPTDASRLVAGGQHRQSFSVQIPVKVRHPFRLAMLKGEVVAETKAVARAIEVCVGLVPLNPRRLLLGEHPAHPHVNTLMPSTDVLEHQVLLTKRFDLEAELAVRTYAAHPWP